jgi:hypothetical protein
MCIYKWKQSHYRPGLALRYPGVWGSQISRHSAHEGDKDVSFTHRPPLPTRMYSSYSYLLETESTPRAIAWPEGLWQWTIIMTSSGIEPATFRLVVQCLNQLRHRMAPSSYVFQSKIHLSVGCGSRKYNNNIYLLQLGYHPVAVVILHLHKYE